MRTRFLLPLLALGFGLTALAAAPAPATDKAGKADAAHIAKLITQLGSDDFDDREKASAELAAIGEPALTALRQAVQSTDEEVHRRAATLASVIEKGVESQAALKARRVHLAYKDAPLKEAVEDFKKQSGYDLTLHDPDDKLKDRTVTLDTGDATFWQAFDLFCAKAGLKEADGRDLASKPPAAGAVPAAAAPAPGVIIIGGPIAPTAAGLPAVEGITLIDGRAEALPTDASSAVRVQALAEANRPHVVVDGEVLVPLRLTLEPKPRWQNVDGATITRAIDDQKQQLVQTATDATSAADRPPPGAGFIAAPPLATTGTAATRQDIVLHFKKGEKASKTLAELSGTISATILGETKPIITATEILKAKDKVFKGGDNGQIKVIDAATDANGLVTIIVELQAPADVVPVGNGPAGPIFRRPIRRVPLPAAPGAGAAPAAVGVAIVIGPGMARNGANGLSLEDDKGQPIKQSGFGTRVQATNAGTSVQYVLTYQPDKGQEAAKLVYSGRKVLHVEIPFALKDVPLP